MFALPKSPSSSNRHGGLGEHFGGRLISVLPRLDPCLGCALSVPMVGFEPTITPRIPR